MPPRLLAYLRIFLVVQALAALTFIWLSHGLVDRQGRALGTDFVSFWSAGALVDAGHAIQAYQPRFLFAMQQTAVPGQSPAHYGFFYPPPFLALCGVLAMLPYGWSLLVWLLSGIAACLTVLKRLLPEEKVVLPFLAFPALWLGIAHGQTCFLVTALFGTTLLWWDRAPSRAAFCAGLLVLKPHLAILPPLLMLIERQGRMLAIWVLTILALVVGSTVLFGIAVWPEFFHAAHMARAVLQQGIVDPGKMVSPFAAIRLLHGGLWLAWAAQAVLALAALLSLRGWRSAPARRFAAIGATTLISPFMLDYDLLLLALPMLALLSRWSVLRRWQQIALLAAYGFPLIGRVLAIDYGVPLGPVVLALFQFAFCRAENGEQRWQEQEAGQQGAAQAQQQQ